MSKHWTERLFIDESDLFKTTIEARFEKTESEINGLLELFTVQGVHQGGWILDLGCGIGRITIPLAKHGFNVVGIDISQPYIERAIEYAEEEGVTERTQFIVGDMRNVASVFENFYGFDAVVSMWTSMGYWDESTDLSILRQCLDLTKPGGVFIIHTVNRDSLIRRFQARDFLAHAQNGMVLLMERKLDLETSRMNNFWSYYRADGENLIFLNRVEINHRVYSLHELKKQFQDAGWKYSASYGGFELKPFTTDIFSMILVAQKH